MLVFINNINIINNLKISTINYLLQFNNQIISFTISKSTIYSKSSNTLMFNSPLRR